MPIFHGSVVCTTANTQYHVCDGTSRSLYRLLNWLLRSAIANIAERG